MNKKILIIVIITGVMISAVSCSDMIGDYLNSGVVACPELGEKITYSAGSVDFKMVFVSGGITYIAGIDDDGDKNNDGDTTDPIDEPGGTTVEKGFEIGETIVTYELWNEVHTWATAYGYKFANPGRQGGDNGTGPVGANQHPVTTISWRDSMVWCNALTEYYNIRNNTALTCVYKNSGTPIRDSRDNGAGHTTSADICDSVVPDGKAVGFRLPTSDEWGLAARYRGSDSTNTVPDIQILTLQKVILQVELLQTIMMV